MPEDVFGVLFAIVILYDPYEFSDITLSGNMFWITILPVQLDIGWEDGMDKYSCIEDTHDKYSCSEDTIYKYSCIEDTSDKYGCIEDTCDKYSCIEDTSDSVKTG